MSTYSIVESKYSFSIFPVFISYISIIGVLFLSLFKTANLSLVNENNFNLIEGYRIPSRNNSLAVGISSSGRVTYTGIENGMYFFIRTNPFLSQNYSKEYMGTDGLNKLRGINIFNDSIYGFLIENDKIKFQNY